MYFLFKMGIFHCYVCLPEGNFILNFHARSFGVSDLDCKIQGGEHPTRERLYSTYDQSKRILGNCHPQQPISISCSAGFWQALWCQVMNFRFEETGGRLFLYIWLRWWELVGSCEGGLWRWWLWALQAGSRNPRLMSSQLGQGFQHCFLRRDVGQFYWRL